MFCKNCGANCPDGAAVCPNCGSNLGGFQQPPVQPNQGGYYPQQPEVPGKGLGIAAMVLGIIACVLCCIWYVSVPCGIIAAALGGVSLSKAKAVGMKNGMATAGIACGCIALGLTILFIVLVAIGLANMGMLY